MEVEEQVHDAVKLLLARIDSHPEEFVNDGKWGHMYQPFKAHWNSTEKKLLAAKLRTVRMDKMHTVLMKELLK